MRAGDARDARLAAQVYIGRLFAFVVANPFGTKTNLSLHLAYIPTFGLRYTSYLKIPNKLELFVKDMNLSCIHFK